MECNDRKMTREISKQYIKKIPKPQIRRVKAIECCSQRAWHDER